MKTLTACAVAELGALGICVYTVLYCSTKTTRLILDLEVLLVLGKDVRDFLLPVRCLLPLALGHGANKDADVKKMLVAVTQWIVEQSAESGGKVDGAAQLLDGLIVCNSLFLQVSWQADSQGRQRVGDLQHTISHDDDAAEPFSNFHNATIHNHFTS